MFISINSENMSVACKHPDSTTLSNVCWIQVHPDIAQNQFDLQSALDLATRYTAPELRLLYRNISGIGAPEKSNAEDLAALCFGAIEALLPDSVDPVEAEAQAKRVPADRCGYYRYVFGSNKPEKLSEMYTGARTLMDSAGEIGVTPAPVVNEKASAASERKAQKKAEREAKAAEKEAKKEAREAKKQPAEESPMPNQPDLNIKASFKQPKQNDVRRPKPLTKCGMVWDYADQLAAAAGRPISFSELKPGLIDAGHNLNNIRSEYARWKKFYGIKGRISTPKTDAA